MHLKRPAIRIFASLLFSAATASAGSITFYTDAIAGNSDAVSQATLTYLNTVVAGMYNDTFTDVNASIYIVYGSTSLGQSQTAFNVVTYSQYVNALAANTNMSAAQMSALAALNTYDAGPYGSSSVYISAPLSEALGLAAIADNGVVAYRAGSCAIGSPGCYDGQITITNSPDMPLYYDNLGGTEPGDAYDFYGVVEHETNEILGTSSCIDTTSGSLVDQCSSFGTGAPSAADLYRYSAAGSLTLEGSLSTTPGAYFSYNGGVTNGAGGFLYNTYANGLDYGDFVSPCGSGPISVQDATGCPGGDAGLSILNDGGATIQILNTVGFDVAADTAPEPGTMALFATGLAAIVAFRRRRA